MWNTNAINVGQARRTSLIDNPAYFKYQIKTGIRCFWDQCHLPSVARSLSLIYRLMRFSMPWVSINWVTSSPRILVTVLITVFIISSSSSIKRWMWGNKGFSRPIVVFPVCCVLRKRHLFKAREVSALFDWIPLIEFHFFKLKLDKKFYRPAKRYLIL